MSGRFGSFAVFRALSALVAVAVVASAQNRPAYPPTRVDVVTDTLHGVKIEDPYRWLEDGASPEVAAWTEAQNALTRAQLDKFADLRAKLAKQLTELYRIPAVTVPREFGKSWFYTRRAGEENHPIVYVRKDDLDTEPHPVLNPNEFSKDGTVALDWYFPSPDGSLIAYGKSSSGDEWSTLHLRDVKSGRDTMFTIPRTRACSVAWNEKSDGFLYTRYPAPGDVPAGDENYNRHVFYHKFGTDWKQDVRVFGEGTPKEQWHNVTASSDFRWQFITASIDRSKNDLYMRKAGEGDFAPVAVGLDGRFEADVSEGKLYLLTNLDAPRFRVLVTDVTKPQQSNWKELIPQGEGVIESVDIAGGKLVLHVLENAFSKLRIYNVDGTLEHEVELPGVGIVTGIGARPESSEFCFTFESYTFPPTIFACDAKKGTTRAIDKPEVAFDLNAYETKQVWAASKDGTKVPMFVTHRKDLKLDGNNPTLLFGYGGFDIAMKPQFSHGAFPWLDAGGVFAVACLRGGGEFGRAWHEAGRLDKKQNVYDDMIACAEKLIADKYTRSERLALRGGSNGGLLMGAMITQRPDLFRAAHCAVPLLDMLRYHKFSIARLWISEYGSADDPKQFEWLRAYSPYHRVKKGEKYPAVLFTTAESDSRVDPLHARKMAALLQASTGGDRPILLWVERKAGHGAGKPLSKRVDEQLDYLTFFMWQLDVLAAHN